MGKAKMVAGRYQGRGGRVKRITGSRYSSFTQRNKTRGKDRGEKED